jgi:hypothetical protein
VQNSEYLHGVSRLGTGLSVGNARVGLDFFGGANKWLTEVVRALKPSGEGPIVVVVLVVAALAALSRGADPYATIFVVLLGFCAFLIYQERKHIWKRRGDEAAYDALERKDAAAVRRKLRSRAQGNRNRDEPTLFHAEEPQDVRDA